MNSLKTIERRHMIPRWQSFSDAFNSGELLHQKTPAKVEEGVNYAYDDILKAEKEWQKEKNIISAIELVQMQKLFKTQLDSDALSFLEKAFRNNDKAPAEIKNFLTDNWETTNKNDSAPIIINKIRKRLFFNYEDAYLWLELARNCLILGNIKKSEKYLLIARSLAPNDRYIARSLMRFYHHTENIDKALYYIETMDNLYKDPMLLSGEIALRNVIGKTSTNIRLAKSIIESQKHSPESISELASEIATMEIINGKERVGKRLLSSSCESLTENSFAQIAWINQKMIELPWINEVYRNKILNNYEGEIYLEFATNKSETNWQYLYEQCGFWSKYQPFSCSPIYMGGVIATDFLNDPQKSFDFSLSALNSHKEDVGILNNLAYSAILNNDKINSTNYLNLLYAKLKTEEDFVLYYATKGLFEFRLGSIDYGKDFYLKSYQLAKKIHPKLYVQVLTYYYRELNKNGDILEKEIIKKEILKTKGYANDFMLTQLLKKFEIIV